MMADKNFRLLLSFLESLRRCNRVSSHFLSLQFFGAVVTFVYAASAFFSYLDWKGDGGNTATNTVPT